MTLDGVEPAIRDRRISGMRLFRRPSKLAGIPAPEVGPKPESLGLCVWALLTTETKRRIVILNNPALQKRVAIMTHFLVSSATAKRDLAEVRKALKANR